MWYRGIRFVKDFLVQYYNYIFLANQKGAIVFTDGTKEIKFSRTPVAIKRASWVARELPSILIGKAGGGLNYISFTKDLLQTETDTLPPSGYAATSYDSYGGDFDLTIGLSIRASSVEERDNLVDIVGIYTAHPDTKDYFMNQYLVLPEAPKLGGESEIHEPGIDHPIYAAEMSVRVMSRWQEFKSEENYTLGDVVADIVAEVSLTEE
jgi:hypothetical protein